MKNYEFTLKFSLQNPEENPEKYIEGLGAAGCDDALIGIGKNGRIALDFIRVSSSAYEAIRSAMTDIKRIIPGAQLIEATPDFVGLTDVADLIGCTRQNMRKLMISGGSAFPDPVHEGKPAIWHLAKILFWLKKTKSYPIEETLIDVARANMHFNIAKEINSLDYSLREEVFSLM